MKKFYKNFIQRIIEEDIISGKCKFIRTRFPPEPNGYLHIGHAKSIVLNFSIAKNYFGTCNLRFDDTNPTEENLEYINSIKHDIKWLGFTWNKNITYSSDYFNELYKYALELIKKNLAYVDESSKEIIKKNRGTLKIPGKNSIYRNRSIQENLFLFNKMRDGKISEGKACLRAKIDMSSPFMVLRDPILYRIKFIKHHQTKKKWCIYPMYDFAHSICDALEGITHSLCTLEFQDNRRLYNWILENINIKNYPKQYEFSRLNIEYNVLSKRKLNVLVKKKIVKGWDDPRMPTISGLRRRGYTASSIIDFCQKIGITKQESLIKMDSLESSIRNDLNKFAPRAMAVINPVLIVIKNLPVNYKEKISMLLYPNQTNMGKRKITFSSKIYIDRSDFKEKKEKNFKRLILNEEVRLRNAYVIKADSFEKDEKGNIKVIFCSYDSNTLNRNPIDGRKINGVIHWVSAEDYILTEFRLYNYLFSNPNPGLLDNYLNFINPDSLVIRYGIAESWLSNLKAGSQVQFEREGYFCPDKKFFYKNNFVFNRIISLKKKYGYSDTN